MKKVATVAAALGVVLALAPFGLAQFGPGQPGQKMDRGRRAMRPSAPPLLRILQAKKEELKVTDEQLAKIKDLMFAFEEKSVKAKNKGALNRLELRKLMQDRDNLDYEAIRQKLSESAAVRQNMFIEKLKLKDEIHGVLTPEQNEALKSLQRERPVRRPGRSMGRMGRRGAGHVPRYPMRRQRAPGRPGFEAGPPPVKK